MPQENSETVKKEEVEDGADEKSTASAYANRNNKSPNSSNATAKPQRKVKKEEKKVKKEEADEDFEKPTSKKASNKTGNKKKKNKKEEAKKMKKKVVKKREKKVFDLPGQKRDPPDERDPLRIFYETLYKQVPASDMAAICLSFVMRVMRFLWTFSAIRGSRAIVLLNVIRSFAVLFIRMMESGLLPKEVAKKIFDSKMKNAQQQKLSSPMKTVVTVKKKAKSVTIEKKSATSPASVQKKKTPSKVASKQLKKRKSKDSSSEDDLDDDFVVDTQK